MKTFVHIAYGVLIGCLAMGVIWILTSQPRGEAVALLPTSTPGQVTIYVSGAVATQGMYELPAGSRIGNAIQAAGGFIAGAEQDRVNLASPLEDGQQIDVPGVVSTNHLNAGRVDINSATVSEFDGLPGIGPTTAQAIVDYRDNHGSFQNIQEIQNVPGIGPATYDEIKDYISIGP